jgi:hypothetical protein
MTIPFLNVTPKSVKLKVSPRFPALLIGGPGVTVTKQNGNYTISVSFDSPTFTSTAIFTGPVVFSGGSFGYGAGSGGVVAQLTSKSTGVTLNSACGQITLNNAALAAATIVSFVLTDFQIGPSDVLVLNHISGGTPGSYSLNAQCAGGSATINVRNNTAGSLSEAIVIQFALIKGANS